jgi:hypothetical protein
MDAFGLGIFFEGRVAGGRAPSDRCPPSGTKAYETTARPAMVFLLETMNKLPFWGRNAHEAYVGTRLRDRAYRPALGSATPKTARIASK